MNVNKKLTIKSRAHQRSRKVKLGGKVRKSITLSATSKKDEQIKGFITCLESLLGRYGLTLCKDTYVKKFNFYFKSIEVSQMPKLFKLSLATYFSKQTSQELPEDWKKSFNVFDKKTERLIFKTCHTQKKKLRFLWDLLQCKDLAEKVPQLMIKQAYEKHWKTLSTVGESPSNVLSMIRPYFREFAEKVKFEFQEKSSLPPRSAYLNCKKSEDGCLGFFKNKNLITSNIFERRSKSDETWRIDPVVIHLIGKPGVGKSFLVEQIVSEITRKFGLPNSVYQRSIATDHWDGYRNQLITVIDDAFSAQDGTEDQKQIIQICSNVPTVLPMADLKEKGRMFNSDFIIITSNDPQKSFTWANTCVNNKEAFMRRIYPAHIIERRSGNDYTVTLHKIYNETLLGPSSTITSKSSDFVKRVVNDAISTHRERSRYNDFVVPVTNNGLFESNLGFKIPLTPPSRLPKVKAHAIPEPLKVRMITKAEEECWVLKPVQKAMWKALKHFPCFSLTNNPNLPLDVIEKWKGEFLLSGDYEAATDNLHQDIMQLAIEELSKVIPSPYREWMIWESQSHEVEYPKNSGLPKIIQTRGQLMGSLLSFPILCIANAACIGIIKKQELNNLETLINGDDILFADSERKIESWKKLTKSIGLKPSIGKNYCAKHFGSINSQLITRDWIGNKYVCNHLATGCFGAVSKTSQFLSNLQHAMKIEPQNMNSHIHRARKLLENTPQSLYVPVSHGGLGIDFVPSEDEYVNLRNKEIYFFKLLEEKCSLISEIDDHVIIRAPKILFKKYSKVLDITKYQEVPTLETEISECKLFNFKKFKNFQKWYKTIPNLRERIKNADLPKEISLNLIDTTVFKLHKSYKNLVMNLRFNI
jgi:hypothetical protein